MKSNRHQLRLNLLKSRLYGEDIRSRFVQRMLYGACIVIIELGAKNLSSVAPLRAPRQFNRGRQVIHANLLSLNVHSLCMYGIEKLLHSIRVIPFRMKDKRVYCENDIRDFHGIGLCLGQMDYTYSYVFSELRQSVKLA